MDSSVRSAIDAGAGHDADNIGGGGLPAAIADGDQRSAGMEPPTASASSAGEHAGGAPGLPERPRQPPVGWQSLLPGSIQ